MFVDGDFWHGRQWAARGFPSLSAQMSRVNSGDYWVTKIERNCQRDERVNRTLKDLNWTVLRIWESQIRTDLQSVASLVEATVRSAVP